jgi:pimeloyl-ACP methyl ester carboxylesterase
MPTVELPGRGTVAYCWNGDGPETVVLVNGSVFNYHQWDRAALPILEQGLRGRCSFLQYDYVGIGGSSPKTAPFSMLDLADELLDLLDALSVERVHLLGISKGSMVSQAFLIRHRERARSFCGLGNPNMLTKEREQTFTTFRARIKALEGMADLWPQRVNRENYARLFNGVYVPTIFRKPFAALSPLERLRLWLVRRMVFPALEGTPVQTIVDLFRYYVDDANQEAPAFAEGLAQVQGVPILLLNGTADMITPVQLSRELVSLLPGAKLVEFDGVTHMGPMMLEKQARPVFETYVAFVKPLL